MSNYYITNEQTLNNIADFIRYNKKTIEQINPNNFKTELEGLSLEFTTDDIIDSIINGSNMVIKTNADKIADYIFRNSKLVYIEMPNVTSIEEHAFENCTN